MAISKTELVVASSAAAVTRGELTFVESSLPGDAWATYSEVLDPDDCAAIDREAYHRARTWYRTDQGGPDPTDVSGASMGRAYELRATAVLVAYLRARVVLARLVEPVAGATVEIRDAGEEWAVAARSLGLRVGEGSRIGRSLASIVPDSGLRNPSRLGRILSVVGRPLEPPSADVVLSESPRWTTTYHGALLRRWPAIAVSPGPRLLLAGIAHGWRVRPTWLTDARRNDRSRSIPFAESPDPGDALIRSLFTADFPELAGWATLGRSLSARVAIAAQDVTPASRAVLLGFQAGGGRVITLEHGIAGGYAEQVHSIADHLGAWGPIQAAYHRQAGPPSMDVVELGWPRLQSAVAAHRADDARTIDVAFFGQPATPLSAGSWPEDALAAHAILESYADRHPSRRVAVKPHPATRAYRAAETTHVRALVVTGDSLSIIRRARVVAAATSTTALEAMAIGRPVIRLVNRGYIGPADFLRDSGAVVSVGDADEFDAAAEELLSSPVAYRQAVDLGRAYASAFVTGLDRPGSAEDRLVESVRALLAK